MNNAIRPVLLSGSFTSTGNGTAVALDKGSFVVELIGGIGTVTLQRYSVAHAQWVSVGRDANKTPVSIGLTGDSTAFIGDEGATGGAQYRVVCTAYTSGTLLWSIAQ